MLFLDPTRYIPQIRFVKRVMIEVLRSRTGLDDARCQIRSDDNRGNKILKSAMDFLLTQYIFRSYVRGTSINVDSLAVVHQFSSRSHHGVLRSLRL